VPDSPYLTLAHFCQLTEDEIRADGGFLVPGHLQMQFGESVMNYIGKNDFAAAIQRKLEERKKFI
jgi:hypothetical protein